VKSQPLLDPKKQTDPAGATRPAFPHWAGAAAVLALSITAGTLAGWLGLRKAESGSKPAQSPATGAWRSPEQSTAPDAVSPATLPALPDESRSRRRESALVDPFADSPTVLRRPPPREPEPAPWLREVARADFSAFNQRLGWSEEQLREQLRRAPESALAGLPLRKGAACRLDQEQAQAMEKIAALLREFGAVPFKPAPPRTVKRRSVVRSHSGGVTIRSETSEVITTQSISPVPRGQLELLLQPGSLPRAKLDRALREPSSPEILARTLVQLLQVEVEPSRRLLIQELANLPGKAGGARLAERALYDLSANLRREAVAALKRRPPEQFRQVLLDGLRHPWPAVADHAAEALAALDDRRAVAELVGLLEAPDPAGPIFDPTPKRYVVREVVQFNHLSNCTLCHEASTSPSDPLRGKIPTPGEPLPLL
jgi:hypothetical protein